MSKTITNRGRTDREVDASFWKSSNLVDINDRMLDTATPAIMHHQLSNQLDRMKELEQ